MYVQYLLIHTHIYEKIVYLVVYILTSHIKIWSLRKILAEF